MAPNVTSTDSTPSTQISSSQPASTPSRSLHLAILAVGTIAAVACSFGSTNVVRAGLAIALLTAVASTWLSWTQMSAMSTRHADELKQAREDAERTVREAAHAHHVESMQIIARFDARKAAYLAQIEAARAEAGSLQEQLAASGAEKAAQQARIVALDAKVTSLEAELAQAGDELHLAEEIMSLPRRGASTRRLDLSRLPLVYPTERKQA